MTLERLLATLTLVASTGTLLTHLESAGAQEQPEICSRCVDYEYPCGQDDQGNIIFCTVLLCFEGVPCATPIDDLLDEIDIPLDEIDLGDLGPLEPFDPSPLDRR
jgi:hypothetical protein